MAPSTPLRSVTVTRYITPLREGGSLPAVVEADDQGTYVLKFRGAGQGRKALVAEVIAGEIARVLGLPMPELVLAQLDAELARTEPDAEIQALIRASHGLNLGMDFLPGALAYDPLVLQPAAELAARIVWFDALVSNIDRTARNTNMLIWHRRLWLIDHGAALIQHHRDDGLAEGWADPFSHVARHVLLPFVPDAAALLAADEHLTPLLDTATLTAIVARVPDDWLAGDAEPAALAADAAVARQAYVSHFQRRLQAPRLFVQEALAARERGTPPPPAPSARPARRILR